MKGVELERAADTIRVICYLFMSVAALVSLWLVAITLGLLAYPEWMPWLLPGYNAAEDASRLQAFLDSDWRLVFGTVAAVMSGLGFAVLAAFYDYQKLVERVAGEMDESE